MSTPLEKIETAFEKGRPAFMPYFTLGYPDMETSIDIVQACAEAGADLMELGIPFSDPLADGPTIQHSTQVALEQGVNAASCLEAVRELRARGIEIPFMLMGYYNPILTYGLAEFVGAAAEAGANGFIIPDLPPEEAQEMLEHIEKHKLGISFLLSPNSEPERAKLVITASRGFTYLVSVIGITGEREALSEQLNQFITRTRQLSDKPLAVGFGISTPEQVQAVGSAADGVIVGSALIKAATDADDPVAAVSKMVGEMASALNTAEKV
ncbi:MAG: tryptophan synthase subunit alpha [Chloroflexi bacterium]|nr:MAG: tryptophan synthase subunit alpha [Chloroflexota bacterium]MBL1192719.1 tryptophan synthase subunit alpha [Chloroflexota bacterium]NOH10011.1 tryptophan synthase subunit alpha [Chloroflexota bacterium]